MELARLYRELESLLDRLEVPVRCEAFDTKVFGDLATRGGLCTVRGKRVVLVDARNPLVERVAVLAQAAAQLDTESVYVAPAVREAIRTYARVGHDEIPHHEHERGGLRLIRGGPDSQDGDDFDMGGGGRG